MGVTWDEPWVDLLHREAEEDLSAAERAQLGALMASPEVLEARTRLERVQLALTALPSLPPPHRQAAQVASDVRWSACLTVPLPRSVAAAVAAEVALSARLTREGVPPPARAVAPEVVLGVRTARQLSSAPPLPRSLAAEVASEVAWAARLQVPARTPAGSVAAGLQQRIRQEREGQLGASVPEPHMPEQRSSQTGLIQRSNQSPARNPAPLLLVLGLLTGLTLLGLTQAWPNLSAGATVLQALVTQVSPLAGVGLALLLAASLVVAWRPTRGVQQFGVAAFALSAALTLPPLYAALARSGVTVGHNVTVHGQVPGNVIAVGGDVTLARDASVHGEVVTLFGNVRREDGARVSGRVNALLGHASGDVAALQTAPPKGLNLATASAFRPLLGWLGGAAWGPVFGMLTGTMLLLLFLVGAAPLLARRQRHAPVRTLALGVLALATLLAPALGLALTGLLAPALLAAAFALLLVATGLSVSAYDLGRTVSHRLRFPQPERTGAVLGMLAVALSLGWPPLALGLALTGGAWGLGTLLLTQTGGERSASH